MSWKPQVYVGGRWNGNQLRFATKAEAEASAADLMSRWVLVEDSCAVESTDPVNYSYENRRLLQVKES